MIDSLPAKRLRIEYEIDNVFGAESRAPEDAKASPRSVLTQPILFYITATRSKTKRPYSTNLIIFYL